MRLICGILRLDHRPASDATLAAMAEAMTAPGLRPQVARRCEGSLGLAVLDFAARPELPDHDGWIVAADLRSRIPAGHATLALDALRRHGPDFPDRIDGDFAVALWDRGDQRLWLGRDFIGVRPLAWTFRPGEWFAFASLPKGLHGAGLASTRIDAVAQGLRLSQSFFGGSDSGFADIAYLPAGHSLCVRPTDTAPPRAHRAYRPDPRAVGRWRGTADEAAATLRTLIEQAVADRMPQRAPIGCHLTGGLDSSAITVLAARTARRQGGTVLALSALTADPVGPARCDERPLINAILAQERDLAHVVAEDQPNRPSQPEDPDWPGTALDGHDDRLMAAAAAFGAGLVLSGVGGDEGASYNGANLDARLLRDGAWASLARQLPLRARRDGRSLARTFYHRVLIASLPAGWGLPLRRAPGVLDNSQGVARFFAPALRRRMAMRRLPPILRTNDPAERSLAFADHHIPSRCTYFSLLAARHGLAVSFPLLDRRVVDFMLSLPAALFLADGYARQPFRRAMTGILPDRVRLATTKVGLFDQRFATHAARRSDYAACLASLRQGDPAIADMFDLDAIEAGLAQLPKPDPRSGAVRGTGGRLANGAPPWLPLMAVECLIAARRMADAPQLWTMT